VKRVELLGALLALVACGPGSRCPVLYGETVSARPLRCADLAEDSKRFDGQLIDVRGRFEHPNGPRIRLLDLDASGDCGRIAGTGIILRVRVEKKVEKDCTRALDRKFARIIGTFSATPDGHGTLGEITPVAVVPTEQ
jgi:hypothetical protein